MKAEAAYRNILPAFIGGVVCKITRKLWRAGML